MNSPTPFWSSGPSEPMAEIGSSDRGLTAAFALPYTGPLAYAFGFVALPWQLMLASVLIVAAYILTREIAKAAYYRRNRL